MMSEVQRHDGIMRELPRPLASLADVEFTWSGCSISSPNGDSSSSTYSGASYGVKSSGPP